VKSVGKEKDGSRAPPSLSLLRGRRTVIRKAGYLGFQEGGRANDSSRTRKENFIRRKGRRTSIRQLGRRRRCAAGSWLLLMIWKGRGKRKFSAFRTELIHGEGNSAESVVRKIGFRLLQQEEEKQISWGLKCMASKTHHSGDSERGKLGERGKLVDEGGGETWFGGHGAVGHQGDDIVAIEGGTRRFRTWPLPGGGGKGKYFHTRGTICGSK